jgi:hypothetical protein
MFSSSARICTKVSARGVTALTKSSTLDLKLH